MIAATTSSSAPTGSGSRTIPRVVVDVRRVVGPLPLRSATKTTERRSLAYDSTRTLLHRLQAKTALKRPAVHFTDEQIRSVAQGFATYSDRSGLALYACGRDADHVHLVTGRPDMKIEQAVIQLKGAATERLVEDGIHPFQEMTDEKGRRPKCFARGEWKVYLDPDDGHRAVSITSRIIREGRKATAGLALRASLDRVRGCRSAPKTPRRG